jgi:F-type H+-transporting ATPase subunit delta
MRDSIAGYADAVLQQAEQSGDVAGVASELTAVRGLVEGSEDLRRVLTDTGVPTAARRNVVTDLLSGQVSEQALGMITYTVDVDRATEVAEDLRWLEDRAVAARDHLVAIGEGPLGRHAAADRLAGYATAVLSRVGARTGLLQRLRPGDPNRQLAEIEDELFRFARVVEGTPDLRAALTDRDVPAAARRQLVVDLLDGKASAETVQMAAYATGVGRARDYLLLLDELVERVAEESNRRVADVRAAVDLDDGQRHRLAAALGRIVGRDVDLRVEVDGEVLGGFIATIGDTVVDGTVRHRLDLLKERLIMPEASVNMETATEEGEQAR